MMLFVPAPRGRATASIGLRNAPTNRTAWLNSDVIGENTGHDPPIRIVRINADQRTMTFAMLGADPNLSSVLPPRLIREMTNYRSLTLS